MTVFFKTLENVDLGNLYLHFTFCWHKKKKNNTTFLVLPARISMAKINKIFSIHFLFGPLHDNTSASCRSNFCQVLPQYQLFDFPKLYKVMFYGRSAAWSQYKIVHKHLHKPQHLFRYRNFNFKSVSA